MADTLVSDDAIDFDPFSAEFHDDPHRIYRRLRADAPVYHSARYGFWALSRHADVAPAMKDFETYSSARGVTLEQVLAPESPERIPMIIMMDPPEHTRMRKLVSKVFTPRAIAELAPMIEATIRTFIERLDPERFDVVADFSTLFPLEVITTMLGVPQEDRPRLRAWLAAPLEREQGRIGLGEEGRLAVEASTALYARLIAERRAAPRDDMISRLVEVEVDREDGNATRLTDREILGFTSLLAGAGAETVAKLVGTAAVLFADHPDQWRALRDDRSLLPGAFEEILRYDGPVQYDVRHTRRDVTLHDRTIPAQSPVLMLLASATRDPDAFPDADRFDITRPFAGHNLGFGLGIHHCLGAALARLEGRIALDAMLDLMPEYDLDRPGLRRSRVTSVAGWTNVPVRVGAR
ncbi:cytochrome P450 [Nocardia transvalensis]|uniref:Cytochrome P450 n=1 Tax=Nocardia transvalensis TaxID=37333 RepID=A0A7W9UM83_9NOCA|nr:cytochrome P450 [Nocardia transvalensis]MBB5918349.1 cytochrome P450 [Nocardia transvalensis]